MYTAYNAIITYNIIIKEIQTVERIMIRGAIISHYSYAFWTFSHFHFQLALGHKALGAF